MKKKVKTVTVGEDKAKERARRVVQGAVQSGAMIRPRFCECCGKSEDDLGVLLRKGQHQQAIQAHHVDYRKPLEVHWLCIGCHDCVEALEGRAPGVRRSPEYVPAFAWKFWEKLGGHRVRGGADEVEFVEWRTRFMLEALWSVEFVSNVQGAGAGVAVLESSKVLGGDSQYFYVGSFRVEAGTVHAKVKVTHYAGPSNSIFGPLSESTLELTGKPARDQFELVGRVVENPNLLIGLRLKRRAELP